MRSDGGQSLIELVVVIAVIIIVVGALVFATIASLRNASFSQNQAQATKLAQEGLEKSRSLRGRDGVIVTNIVFPSSNPSRNINRFSELWSVRLAHDICNTTAGDAPCFFRFISNTLNQGTGVDYEIIGQFKRQVLIGDNTTDYDKQKTVTVVVTWTDVSGAHESKLTTILGEI